MLQFKEKQSCNLWLAAGKLPKISRLQINKCGNLHTSSHNTASFRFRNTETLNSRIRNLEFPLCHPWIPALGIPEFPFRKPWVSASRVLQAGIQCFPICGSPASVDLYLAIDNRQLCRYLVLRFSLKSCLLYESFRRWPGWRFIAGFTFLSLCVCSD